MTASTPTPHPIPGPTSPQSSFLASGQSYLCLPTFTLESGEVLSNVPIAYKTWGRLSASADNALVVCHALTGSADVEDWWGPLLGPSKLFDPTRFFIFCANVLGSPYGSAGPCTRLGGESLQDKAAEAKGSWDGTGWWGPEFPATTVRDDVRIQKLVLDYLGVEQIAAVVGGSMGGMAVLEWPLCFPVRFPSLNSTVTEGTSTSARPYIRAIVPIATAARHSAWCISWAEAQRQSIYSDPAFDHGYYAPDKPPRAGLAAARMAALLTYRSRDSFESRFGRRTGKALRGGGASAPAPAATAVAPTAVSAGGSGKRASPDDGEAAARLHNEGNSSPRIRPSGEASTPTPLTALAAHLEASSLSTLQEATAVSPTNTSSNGTTSPATSGGGFKAPKVFSAQSYLRYQGDKFVRRFDANCYIHLTRKMDTHDVARGRALWGVSAPSGSAATKNANGDSPSEEADDESSSDAALARVLRHLSRGTQRDGAQPPAVLVVSIESDGLFAPPEQTLLHALIAGSEFVSVASPDGHDGFLLEFEQINAAVGAFLRKTLTHQGDGGSEVWSGQGVGWEEWKDWGKTETKEIKESTTGSEKAGEAVKESMFGEVEDVTRW